MHLTTGKEKRLLRFLEVGCGAGNNLWFAAASGFEVFGLDISPTAIEYARKRLHTLGYMCVDLRVGDLTSLPWPDDSFDIVLDRGALTQNNYKRIRTALKEITRVLRPNGTFLTYTLYGLGHSDRKYGTEVSENTFDHFTGGYFANVGLTSFFDESSISILFSGFSNLSIQHHVTTSSDSEVIQETYSAKCTK